jgi:hypothetical protein
MQFCTLRHDPSPSWWVMTAAATPPSSSRSPAEVTDERDPDDRGPGDQEDQDPTSIRVATEGTTVVIAVEHCLDMPTGEALLSAAAAAVAAGPTRLDIDLRALENFTLEGADALVGCRALSAKLAGGLHYRTGRGPGRDALLAAYSDLDGAEMAD